MRRLLSWLHYLLLLLVLAVLILVSALRVGVHSHPLYHQELENWLSSVLQQPIAIADFNLHLQGRELAIDINGASLGQDALALQRLSLRLNVYNLILDQQLSLSNVQLFGLSVELKESAAGVWLPKGIQPLAQTNASASSDTIFGLFQTADKLSLIDAQLNISPLDGNTITLQNVAAVINPLAANRVALNLQADYPDTQGKLGVLANIRFSDNLSLAESDIQLQLQELPINLLAEQFEQLPLAAGQVSAQAWLHLEQDRLKHIHIRGLQLQSVYQDLPLRLQGDFDITNQSDLLQIQMANLDGAIAQQNLPVSDLALVSNGDDWQLATSRMRLDPIAKVVEQMTHLPSKVTTPILQLRPQGLVHQPRFYWQSSQPKAFLFSGTMQDASVSAWRGIPAVDGADGLIAFNAKGGKVTVDDQDSLTIHVPKLTSRPWPFDGMQGEVAWRLDSEYSYLDTSLLQLNQDEGLYNLIMDGHFPRRGKTHQALFQMRLGMQDLDVVALPALLPDMTMGTALGDYIAKAAQAGRIKQGGITYNGAVGKQAKALGPYSFSVPVWGQAQLPKVNYAKDWPAVNAVSVDFSSNHQHVGIHLKQGQLLGSGEAGLPLRDWQIEVPILATQDKRQAMIAIKGALQGDGQLLQKVAKTLPPQVTIPSWIMDLNPSGDVQLSGRVGIPYGPYAKGRQAQYDIGIFGDQVAGFWQQQQVSLEQVVFNARVTDLGVQNFQAQGLVDGHSLGLGLTNRPEHQNWQYALPVDVWQTYGIEQQPNAWLNLQGSLPSDYVVEKLSLADINFGPLLPRHGQVDVFIPACLFSSAQCQVALGSLQVTPDNVNWPTVIDPNDKLIWLWQRQQEQQGIYISNTQQQVALGIDNGNLTTMGIGLGKPAPKATRGINISGELDLLDVPYWLDFLPADKTNTDTFAFPEVQNIDLLAKQLQWQDLLVDNVQISYLPEDKGWTLALLSEAITGQIVNKGDTSPWQVNVDHFRLLIPEEPDEEVEEAEEDKEKVDLLAAIDPGLIPDMDLQVKEISKNQQSYGNWRLKARNKEGILYLHDIDANIHNSQLLGNMIWDKQGQQHKTSFSGRIFTPGVAETLTGWGYSPTIDSSYGALEAQLAWSASPLGFDIEKSTGDFELRVKEGEFADAPSLAGGLKILGLLDMGRLLQRLRLDFTDIFNDEYQFDSIYAHYNITDGIARNVTPATFKSTSLELLLDGTIDFNTRTVENDLYITLPVTDKLSFAALLAGLPQVSGVLYVVDKLVGDELSTFTTARYGVTGDLDRPDLGLRQIFDAKNQPKSLEERLNNVFKLQ